MKKQLLLMLFFLIFSLKGNDQKINIATQEKEKISINKETQQRKIPIKNKPKKQITTQDETKQEIKKTTTKKKEIKEEKKEIVFGQTGSFSGSLKAYSEMIKTAINTCFKAANNSGNLANIKLRLESLDDKGQANIAAKNIQKLYKKNKIDMFLGCTGTRGVLKVLPLIESEKIAMFFPWGGDKKLMRPNLTHQINGLGLMAPQTEKLINYIVKELRLKKIALFHSDGDFSVQTAKKTISQLTKYGISPVKTASYNRFTMDIESTSKKLIEADPKIVLCLATSMPTAKLINDFFAEGHFGTLFFGIDSTLFVKKILKDKGDIKFKYSSSVPNPTNDKLAIVKEFQTNLKKYYPESFEENINILSLAYYIQAKIIVEAIKIVDEPITKEKIIKAIENMKNFDLGGFEINFNPLTRYAFGQNIILIKG